MSKTAMSSALTPVMAETTLRIVNPRGVETPFQLEPWGETFMMPPHGVYTVIAYGPTGDGPEVTTDDDGITVWGWAGSVLRVFDHDVELGRAGGLRPPMPGGASPAENGVVSRGSSRADSDWRPAGYGAPLLVVISGPTAVGKTTILRRMKELGLPYAVGVTATTRPRREGETDGIDYHFVDIDRFQRMVERDELLEHAIVHGLHRYGIPSAPIRELLAQGRDVLIPPEVQGAATVRARVPGAVTIFIAAPSFDDLERRIRARRSESEEEIQRRLATARAEMDRVHEFDYLIVNEEGQLDDSVWAIDAIIRAERLRLHRPPVVV